MHRSLDSGSSCKIKSVYCIYDKRLLQNAGLVEGRQTEGGSAPSTPPAYLILNRRSHFSSHFFPPSLPPFAARVLLRAAFCVCHAHASASQTKVLHIPTLLFASVLSYFVSSTVRKKSLPPANEIEEKSCCFF